VAGMAGVSCSSSDATDTATGGTAGKATGKAGSAAVGGDTSAGGDTTIVAGAAGESAGGSAPVGPEEGGAAGAPTTPAGGSTATGGTGGSATDDMAASIARGLALTTQPSTSCTTCHGATFAGQGFYPNITPDEDTGIGDWTDDQIKAAITLGKKNDGTNLCTSMERYPFTASQVTDVVAYLRSLNPVTHTVTDKCPG
jgi:hypothetical protein